MEVLTSGHPVLRIKCTPVGLFEPELHRLLDGMKEAMTLGDGVGIAANQVGATVRAFLLKSRNWGLVEAVNPELSHHMGVTYETEGCLSVPNVIGKVRRARCVTLTYQTRRGTRKTIPLAGIDAVCAQHEMDHLDGILFTDKIEEP